MGFDADRRGRPPAGSTPAARWVIALALAAAGFLSVIAPGARDADAPSISFSAERALEHIAVIASEPHPMGSAANAAVRDYLVGELRDLGLEPDLRPVSAPDIYGQGGSVTIVNVVARIPGTNDTRAVALMGHYDTEPTTPGANDNSSAVATLLETARALTAGPPVRNDVILLFTDGEEPFPRFGSPALVADQALLAQIGLVVNLETNGGSGPSLLVETSGPEGWLIEEYAAATARPAAFSFLTEIVRLLGDVGTDFDVFRNAGVAGFHFAYLRGSPIYHTPADNLDAVGLPSLQHHGLNALGIARHFGNLDLERMPDSEPMVFFTLRPFFVRYPANWSVPLAIVVALLFAGATVLMQRRSALTAAAVGARVGGAALAGLLAATAGTVLWMVLVRIRSTPGVVESYAYFVALAALVAWLTGRATARSRRRSGPTFSNAMVLLWVVLAVTTAVSLPGVSYLFLWPALISTLVLLGTAAGRRIRSEARFVLTAGPTIVLTVPAIDTFLQMAQPRPGNPDSELPFAMFVPLVLTLLVIGMVLAATQGVEPPAETSASDV